MVQRITDVASRMFAAALALPFLVVFGAPAAVAQPADAAAVHAAKSAELEQRVMDIVQMFQNDPRYNKGKTPEQIKDGVEFVTGNVLFVLAHETGHALISVFQIPVIGREEDAADSLATIVSLKMANSFADRVVTDAARGWFLSDQRDKQDGSPTPFYDEHGLDLQRAYNIVCLLVGGAPDKFRALADEVKLPRERQDTCRFDFSNASWSWDQVLKPHMRKSGDPKTKIPVNYAEPGEYATIAMLGQKLQILESIAGWLSEDFVWETPISLEMQQCGDEAGTRWLPTQKKIIVCYEMIREFIQLHRRFGQLALVPGDMKMVKYGKISVAARPTAYKKRTGKAYRAQRAQRAQR